MSSEERRDIISKRLHELGMTDPLWNKEITGFILSDLEILVARGMEYDEAVEAVFDNINLNQIRNFSETNPINRMHEIYRYLMIGSATFAVLLLVAAFVTLIMGLTTGILLLITALVIFAFLVFPVRMLYRTRKDRMERMYRQIYIEPDSVDG